MVARETGDYAPDLRQQREHELETTILGFCNESGLTRMQILGCIEAAKHTMMRAWHAQDEREAASDDDEDEAWQTG
jgi:hypothetical protein